jgi:aminoglycoside phosphotransferase (APT) family kinase protein
MNNLEIRSRPTAEWIADLRARYPVERTVDEALTRKLMRRASGAAVKTDLLDLRARLDAFLARRIEGPFEVRNLAVLTGGASKEQFSFEIDWNCNGERRTGERMVLRREPGESVVESDRLREFQLVAAMRDIVPVPTAYWLDHTGEELVRPTLIYGFASGVQKPPSGSSNVTGVGIEFDAEHRAAIGPQMIDYLARIHNFKGGDADLSAFDVPEIGTTQDITWQINWWARVWEEDMYEAVPLVTIAEQWLRANRRPLDVLSLVHSDYRTGNYLFDPATKKITAVLDWELGYFGDRHFDLAWLLMPAFTTPDENGAPLHASIFPRDEFIAAYQEASGLAVDGERLHYYTVLALWKGVILTLGSALRAAGGLKSHHDVVLAWFGGLGYPMLESLRRALAEVTTTGEVSERVAV